MNGPDMTSRSMDMTESSKYVKVHGVQLLSHKDMVYRHHQLKGSFEPLTIKVWLDTLSMSSADDIFIDVGAYSGIYAILAAKSGATAIALEPNPKMYERLCLNMTTNRVMFRSLNVAAGSFEGNGTYHTSNPYSSAGWVNFDSAGETVVVTLDEEVGVGKPVKAIKIDVEGDEIEVLKGSVNIIDRYKPLIIAEANDDKHAETIKRFLEPKGYDCRLCDARNLICRS